LVRWFSSTLDKAEERGGTSLSLPNPCGSEPSKEPISSSETATAAVGTAAKRQQQQRNSGSDSDNQSHCSSGSETVTQQHWHQQRNCISNSGSETVID